MKDMGLSRQNNGRQPVCFRQDHEERFRGCHHRRHVRVKKATQAFWTTTAVLKNA